MGRQVTKWVSEDGQEFVDERSMLLHELELVDAKEIELFIQKYPEKKGKEYSKVLLDWQKYQRENQPLFVPETPGLTNLVFAGANGFGVEVAEGDRRYLVDPTAYGEDIFSQVQQGPQISAPRDYALDDEDAAIEESFRRATKI